MPPAAMQTEDAPIGEALAGSTVPLTVPRPPRKSRASGVVEWFLRRQRLEAVRRGLAQIPEPRLAFERRARHAAELGRAALEPGAVREAGSADAVACELYRQAAYWACAALTADSPAHRTRAAVEADSRSGAQGDVPSDFPDLLQRMDASLLLEAASGPASLADLQKVLHEQHFQDFGEFTLEEQARLAWNLRRFVERLLTVLDRPNQELALIRLQRWTRLSGLVLCVAVLVGAGLFLAEFSEQKRDLARDKSHRVSSSSFPGCPSPLQFCDETPSYFFHTGDEKEPWVEIDLGVPTRFSAVRVINRRDCCFDRAPPLVVEVSLDQKQFQKVAEREKTFTSWKAKFSPVVARYVRVRHKGRGILHLASVRVLP